MMNQLQTPDDQKPTVLGAIAAALLLAFLASVALLVVFSVGTGVAWIVEMCWSYWTN